MKYYILDENGFYLGLTKDNPDGYDFFTTVPISGNFFKFKFDGENWIEGAAIEEIALKNDELDDAFVMQLESDGIELKHRHKKRLRRRVDELKMTQAESKTVRQLLHDSYKYLNEGEWDNAYDKAFAIVGQPNKIQNEIDWLVTKITEYTTLNNLKLK